MEDITQEELKELADMEESNKNINRYMQEHNMKMPRGDASSEEIHAYIDVLCKFVKVEGKTE